MRKTEIRVFFYNLVSQDMVKTILKYNLDYLPLNKDTDIFGQYRLNFENIKEDEK